MNKNLSLNYGRLITEILKQARLTQKLSGYDALKMEVHVRN